MTMSIVPPRCMLVLPLTISAYDAVLTTHSAAAAVIPANGKAVVPTDLAIACPPGTYARIAPRSGLAVKHFIDTGAGRPNTAQSRTCNDTGAATQRGSCTCADS